MAVAQSQVLTAVIFGCCFSMAAVLAEQGTATSYTPPSTPSDCDGYKNDGVMIAAASKAIWENGGACGKKYKVKCLSGTNRGVERPCKPNKNVVLTIVDFCPAGCQGTIDLSQEAFRSIADLDAGKINIEFHQQLMDTCLVRVF